MSLYLTCSIITDGTQDCSAVPQYDMSTGILETVTLTWGAFFIAGDMVCCVHAYTCACTCTCTNILSNYNIVHVL